MLLTMQARRCPLGGIADSSLGPGYYFMPP
jgi:hypothetical protein